MNIAILLSIITLISYGISNPLQKPAIDKIGALKQITLRGTIICIISFIIAILFTDFSNVHYIDILLSVLLSGISYLGLLFLGLGLKYSKPGIVIPIVSSDIVFATFFSLLFFQQEISPIKYIFMFFIIMGVVLMSINLKDIKNSFKSKGPLYALLGGLFWGLSFTFYGYFGNKIGTFLFTFILEFTALLISIFHNYLNNKNKNPLPSLTEIKKVFVLMLFIGGLGAIASISMNVAYSIGNTAIVAAITGCSPLVAVIFSRVYLKDKIKKIQYIAAIIIVLGIVGISLLG